MADLSRVIPSLPALAEPDPAPREGEADPFAPVPRLRRPRPERVLRLLAAIDPGAGPGRPQPGPSSPPGADAGVGDPLAAAFAAGERAAEDRFAEERARLEARHAAALEVARTAAYEETGAALAEAHAAAVRTLADGLDAALSAALAPILVEAARRRAVDALLLEVHRLLAHRPETWLELTGPSALLAAFRERLGPAAAAVDIIEDEEQTDLRLVADNTIFTTTIAAFAAEVEAAARPLPTGEPGFAPEGRQGTSAVAGEAAPLVSTPRVVPDRDGKREPTAGADAAHGSARDRAGGRDRARAASGALAAADPPAAVAAELAGAPSTEGDPAAEGDPSAEGEEHV